ncbi:MULTISPECIES: hypothetical protein [unclassified Streptomyces]|uniref:hypothetical protein n=1 Tax=unclassified Streptomyces TaxID=2593676 RepID=UPI002E0E7A93|nr:MULTISPECIES: hypothetical protein [unclassified Streptomyces]WSR27691.1 hypothetical protein OG573_17010 [Streptomyces sp. NBC_01205]
MSGSATGTGTPDGRAPADPATTEAGRLLCAGTYLDPAYRDRVIEELYVHEERFPAPSYGFDATRVLAHALRALRTEAAWSAAIVATWGLGLFLTRTFFLFLLLPALLLSGAGRIKKRRERIGRGGGRIFEWILRGYACFVLARILWGVLRGFFADDAYVGGSGGLSFLGEYLKQVVMDNPLGIFLEVPRIGESYGESYSWTVVLIAVLVTVLVGFRREHFAQIIHSSLSRAQYADRGADPTAGRRFRRVRDEIERSQHAQVVLYEVGNPFCGAGKAHLPWQLAVELRPRAGTQARRLDNGAIIEQIRPKLEALRIPSPRGSEETEDAVLDRLRELVVDECVFLPAAGLPDVDAVDLSAEAFAAHRAGAVEEGGERRRHFLRVRIGGWDENLVITVFIRVHTQGGMLMLEVAPHVLLPVRPDFQRADDIARRHRRNTPVAKVLLALSQAPGSLGVALATLGGACRVPWRLATAGHSVAYAAGPAASVRELASQEDGSLFQLMDLDRYLKTIQERIVGGVTLALHDAGWHTEEFAERAVNVADGGVFIQSVSNSAFGIHGVSHNSTVNHGKTADKAERKDGRVRVGKENRSGR